MLSACMSSMRLVTVARKLWLRFTAKPGDTIECGTCVTEKFAREKFETAELEEN